ncbi:MAG: rRNA maturation RNase YbeY [Alphaproteobacteria bacterium]|nr:MAG: rRNA maturation RNase YbeY [Alphaproteobacteria bacterium]
MTRTGQLPLTEIDIADRRWRALDLARLAETARRAALEAAGLDPSAYSISLLAADDARLAELNARFRGRETATNVLSWPAFPLAPPQPGARPPAPPPASAADPVSLGDIALSWDRLVAEAAGAGIAPRDHALHLVLHATLHLLGYDHATDADATLMEGLESRILVRMGVKDPYCNPGPAEGPHFRLET